MENKMNGFGITIRRLEEADEAAIARLAELDSATRPAGALLGAEIEGRLLAAVSITTGKAIADPFARTAELRGLLEMRSSQLRGDPARRPSRFRRHRSRRKGRASAQSVTDGSLLTLPSRVS